MSNAGMSKGFWKDIANRVRAVAQAAARPFQFFIRGRLSRWRPISTAPSNQELEVRILEDGKVSTLEFPCVRTNDGSWLDVDLGSAVKIEPTQWRHWPYRKSPNAHHARIKASDRSELYHIHGKVTYRDAVHEE
jgi:hypothetical protein